MTDTITIHNGTFSAELVLERLPEVPLKNRRKLFKLALTDGRNEGASCRLDEYLPEAAVMAENNWRLADKLRASGWRHRPTTAPDREFNNCLTTLVREAKATYTRAKATLALYEKMKGSNYNG